MAIDTTGAKILVVDDNQKNVQVLGTILMQEKYSIAVVMSGVQVLEQAKRIKPDLILLDIMMPDVDGFEVCKRLKADPEVSAIPVIFLTAKVETDDIVKGFELGAVDYVTKPFKSRELLARVSTHVTNTRLKQCLQKKNEELTQALHEVKTLEGMLPICANCKKIRDDKGYWNQIEEYIADHSNAIFSHGICPDCTRVLYPEIWAKMHDQDS